MKILCIYVTPRLGETPRLETRTQISKTNLNLNPNPYRVCAILSLRDLGARQFLDGVLYIRVKDFPSGRTGSLIMCAAAVAATADKITPSSFAAANRRSVTVF